MKNGGPTPAQWQPRCAQEILIIGPSRRMTLSLTSDISAQSLTTSRQIRAAGSARRLAAKMGRGPENY